MAKFVGLTGSSMIGACAGILAAGDVSYIQAALLVLSAGILLLMSGLRIDSLECERDVILREMREGRTYDHTK